MMTGWVVVVAGHCMTCQGLLSRQRLLGLCVSQTSARLGYSRMK